MYTEWADYLADQKCGGEPEPYRWEVQIGEKYNVYWIGHFEGTITVDEVNKIEIERNMNDPENDVWEYEKV